MEISLITWHTELKTLQRYANLRPSILASKLDGAGMSKRMLRALDKINQSPRPKGRGMTALRRARFAACLRFTVPCGHCALQHRGQIPPQGAGNVPIVIEANK
jgi:hypothetical protein